MNLNEIISKQRELEQIELKIVQGNEMIDFYNSGIKICENASHEEYMIKRCIFGWYDRIEQISLFKRDKNKQVIKLKKLQENKNIITNELKNINTELYGKLAQ